MLREESFSLFNPGAADVQQVQVVLDEAAASEVPDRVTGVVAGGRGQRAENNDERQAKLMLGRSKKTAE